MSSTSLGPLTTRVHARLDEIEEDVWDALVGDDDPFVEYAFLSRMEASGSVSAASGVEPRHITVWHKRDLVGALPLYRKSHSYGEYVFDFAWADGARRLGVPYYPKLVSMAPFTPATGRRFLVHPGHPREPIVDALLARAVALADEERASSLHLLYLDERERGEALRFAMTPRIALQFHFERGERTTFDDYLASMRASARKQVRRERRRVAEANVDVRVLAGAEIDRSLLTFAGAMYRDTCEKKGSYPYLTDAFFEMDPAALARRAVIVLASRRGEPLAMTLNFEKGRHLYGRYWGATEDVDALHFECCYYQLIERALARRLDRFEAGAQGVHKLKRGLLPRPVHSAHYIRHGALARAVAHACTYEEAELRERMVALEAHGPFRDETDDEREG